MKLLLENWREYLYQEELEEGLPDFFKKKEEIPVEEVVPPTPKAYFKSLRSARSRRLPAPGRGRWTNIPYMEPDGLQAESEGNDCFSREAFDGKVKCMKRTKGYGQERAQATVAKVLRAKKEIKEADNKD